MAAALSLALVALSPGWGCYRAMASMVGSVGTAARGAGAGSVGVAGIAAATRVPGQPGALGPVSLQIPAGGLSTLSQAPNVRIELTPARAHAGIAAPGAVSPTRSVPAARMRDLRGAKSMPDTEPEPREDPIDHSDLDENGNTRRRTSGDGPDDVYDEFGGDGGRGNDTLFSRLEKALPEWNGASLGDVKSMAYGDFQSRIGLFGPIGGRGMVLGRNGVKSSKAKLKKGSKRAMPDADSERSDDPVNVDDLDELGNPRRRSSGDGPDDVYDEFGGDGGRGNSDLFGISLPLVGLSVFGAAAFGGIFSQAAVTMIPLYLGIIVPSIILHEMGHAWMANKLGDPTPKLAGRMSFRPRDLLTHIDPIMTLLVPIATMLLTGFIFGGARPVQVDVHNFKRPVKDMAKVAMAGPAVNFILAAGAGIAHAALAAMGVTGITMNLLAIGTFFNVMLGMFNLLPFLPLDGHHVVRHILTNGFKAPDMARKLDSLGQVQIIGLIAALVLFSAPLVAAIKFVTGVFLAAPGLLMGGAPVQMAAAVLPAVMAVGLLLGMTKGKFTTPNAMRPEGVSATTIESAPQPVDYIVRLQGASTPLSHDVHLSMADVGQPGGMRLYASMQRSMEEQLEEAGLGRKALAAYDATPIATYKRINSATIRVAGTKAADFRAAMEQRGYQVFENERREIVRPIEDDPEIQPLNEPAARKVSLQETLEISKADKVQAIARSRWGAPGAGFRAKLARAILSLTGVDIPQPRIGVIDTGVDLSHPLLKGVAEVRNATSGPNVDDNGHGTWVTSLVLWFAPWLKSVRHYKAFVNGGGSLDDILKALTMAGNDGNLVISNSWGSGRGDPKSPDSEMVKKLAAEGHIMVFSAGNSGYYGKNTIGSPAIAHYRAPGTNAPRVIAVAATDGDKKVSGFSSKGPGSRVTSRGGEYEDYPRKPDIAEQGENTEGAWPASKRPDRVDEKLGPLRAISGTSMSTPKLAGTIALLAMLFGVTEMGEKLDRIVNAVVGTVTNEHGQPDWAIGDGFNDVQAAYAKLEAEGMRPIGLGFLSGLVTWLLGFGRAKAGPSGMNGVAEAKSGPAKGWIPVKLLEQIVDELAYLKDVRGFKGFRIDEAAADHPNSRLAGKRYLTMVFRHPDDLMRYLQTGTIAWTVAGMPAVVEFLDESGVRKMTAVLEKKG